MRKKKRKNSEQHDNEKSNYKKVVVPVLFAIIGLFLAYFIPIFVIQENSIRILIGIIGFMVIALSVIKIFFVTLDDENDSQK